MKHLLSLLLLLCLSTSVAVAVPGYDPNLKTRHYDMSEDLALRDKLKADFNKKYPVTKTVDANGSVHYSQSYPTNAYNLEVTTPYYQMVDNNYHYVD